LGFQCRNLLGDLEAALKLIEGGCVGVHRRHAIVECY
jgi:hypothetical protein